ncbi:hypothetical protein Nepgr_027967 [Nepenthes gracilis]|uniref:Uncharacterized protein n=1 Tax=Nepenthes gracilis TaxID=150966 RepID=A0AAD3TBB9_NEPGR|nr:hypothetical protein Nepgr_027967 [Nepenthes gracilis]
MGVFKQISQKIATTKKREKQNKDHERYGAANESVLAEGNIENVMEKDEGQGGEMELVVSHHTGQPGVRNRRMGKTCTA